LANPNVTSDGAGEHLDRVLAMLPISLVPTIATCVLLAGCTKELTSTASNRVERGISPDRFESPRGVSSRQAPLGPFNQESLSSVGGVLGSRPASASDLAWVVSKDRQDRVGVPLQIVMACRSSIVDAGRAYGMTWADVASAGRMLVRRDGAVAAPIEARLTYRHAGLLETKHSLLKCHLSPEGAVVALR
jgi:hypothetical protein